MDQPLKELDVVALVTDRPAQGLRRGSVGTVVHVHAATSARPVAYEVEFVDRDGNTYAMVALRTEELLPLHIELSAA